MTPTHTELRAMIPEPLHQEIRVLAAQEGKARRIIVEQLIRLGLEERSKRERVRRRSAIPERATEPGA